MQPIMEKLSLGDEDKSRRCINCCGSGYGLAWIRIGLALPDPDPDPGARKWTKINK